MAPRKKTEEKTVTETTPNTETTALHVGDMVYDRSVLATVNAGGADGATISTEQASKLVELGLIVTHPNGPNAEGNVLVALTDLGREAQAFNEANPQESITAKKTRAKSDIQFGSATVSDDDIPLPPSNRRGRTGEKYPFASRAKGKSFHIPVVVPEGGDGAELAKKALSTIASSVSTNNKKYKDTPHPVDNAVGAKFQAKAVGAEDPEGFGVRVWRVA